MSSRQPRFNQSVLIDTTPLPDSIPPVREVGASSAPLMSASYYIGARCRAFNDDYMKCKTDAHGTGEFDCMREGRKVTRCAASVIDDITKNCAELFRTHWECLETNNQQMWHCRQPEQRLEKCVSEKIGLKKIIPGVPDNETPVNLRPSQIFSYNPLSNRMSDKQLEREEDPVPTLSWSEKRQRRKEWIKGIKEKQNAAAEGVKEESRA